MRPSEALAPYKPMDLSGWFLLAGALLLPPVLQAASPFPAAKVLLMAFRMLIDVVIAMAVVP